MRRAHLTIGLVGVAVFLLTGQFMAQHTPPVRALSPDVRMMYISRHIYLLGSAIVNLVLGLYLAQFALGWKRGLQQVGSMLFLVAPVLLTIASFLEPERGLAGRSWWSTLPLFALLGEASLIR